MPTTKSVKIVDSGSTKADELGALHKMVECAGPGSYLASLFSDKFVAWVERQVRDDGCCDLYGTLEMAHNEQAKLVSQRAAAEEKVKKLSRDLDEALSQCSRLLEDKETLRGEIAGQTKVLADVFAQQQASGAADRRKMFDLRLDIQTLQQSEKRLQGQIVTLKAMLFDKLYGPVATADNPEVPADDSDLDAEREQSRQERESEWAEGRAGDDPDVEVEG